MSTSKRSGALLVLGGAVVLAAVVLGIVALNRGEPPLVAPPPPTTASPRPQPAPHPQPARFDVALRTVGVQETGNGRIYRQRPGNTRRGARRHARAAVDELNRYLNAALVDPTTRFTDGPLRRLLTGDAEREMNRRGRRALGVGAPPIVGGRTGKARARAVVLYDGRTAHAVTVKYRARMAVLVPGAARRQLLRQRGVMVFVPTRAGWRADMVDVRSTLPRRVTGERPDPAATGGTS